MNSERMSQKCRQQFENWQLERQMWRSERETEEKEQDQEAEGERTEENAINKRRGNTETEDEDERRRRDRPLQLVIKKRGKLLVFLAFVSMPMPVN